MLSAFYLLVTLLLFVVWSESDAFGVVNSSRIRTQRHLSSHQPANGRGSVLLASHSGDGGSLYRDNRIDDQQRQSSSLAASRDDKVDSDATITMVASESWMDCEEAWRASFSRNNFADFVPSDCAAPEEGPQQRCLSLAGTDRHRLAAELVSRSRDRPTLPWDASAEHSQVSVLLLEDTNENFPSASRAPPAASKPGTHFLERPDTVMYDVILDKGLLEDLIRLCKERDLVHDGGPVGTTLQQASAVIRENGIYVLLTSPLAPHMQEFLQRVGESVGLAWQFHLDGISSEHMGVSVARKMCTDYHSGGGGGSTNDKSIVPTDQMGGGRLLP